MFFQQRFVPGLAIASYMVGDEKTKEVAVIDPTRDVDDFIRIAREEGLRITHILETHVHADFVSGPKELKSRLSGEPFWLSEVQALRGENYRAQGQLQRAEASYTEALRLNSGNRTAAEGLTRLQLETPSANR